MRSWGRLGTPPGLSPQARSGWGWVDSITLTQGPASVGSRGQVRLVSVPSSLRPDFPNVTGHQFHLRSQRPPILVWILQEPYWPWSQTDSSWLWLTCHGSHTLGALPCTPMCWLSPSHQQLTWKSQNDTTKPRMYLTALNELPA